MKGTGVNKPDFEDSSDKRLSIASKSRIVDEAKDLASCMLYNSLAPIPPWFTSKPRRIMHATRSYGGGNTKLSVRAEMSANGIAIGWIYEVDRKIRWAGSKYLSYGEVMHTKNTETIWRLAINDLKSTLGF